MVKNKNSTSIKGIYPLCRKFNRKHGVITHSGTLALEIALKNLNLKKNAKVLMVSNVCYCIPNTVKKLGLKPVFIEPENEFFLETYELVEFLERNDIDCFLLVHMYGIYNNIDLNIFNYNIPIIEDLSQMWFLGKKNYLYTTAKESDILITSFGKSKPLSCGYGGALLFNSEKYFNNIDFCDNYSRGCNNILLSYANFNFNKFKIKKLMIKANSYYLIQNINSKLYMLVFKKIKFNNYFSYYNKNNTWHRFPIWFDNKKDYEYFIKKANKYKIKFQILHDLKINELDLYKNDEIHLNKKIKKKYCILLRTRMTFIFTQILFLKKVLKLLKYDV